MLQSSKSRVVLVENLIWLLPTLGIKCFPVGTDNLKVYKGFIIYKVHYKMDEISSKKKYSSVNT